MCSFAREWDLGEYAYQMVENGELDEGCTEEEAAERMACDAAILDSMQFSLASTRRPDRLRDDGFDPRILY